MSSNLTIDTINKIFSAIEEYLRKKRYKTSNFQISALKIDPGSDCDNSSYMSSIFRISFEASENNQSVKDNFQFILKSKIIDQLRNNDDAREYFWNAVFAKEHLMFTTILDRMNKMLPNSILTPKLHYFFGSEDEYCCFLLEDLSCDYYSPSIAGSGISLDEGECIVKTLGRFHALSLLLESEESKPLVEAYEFCGAETFFGEGVDTVMKDFVQNTYAGIIEAALQLRPHLGEKMKKLNNEKNVWNRLCEYVQPGKVPFSVLCHGDPRSDNIFLPKNLKILPCAETQQTKLIDFQLVRYASPITDLQYAISLCTTKDFRSKYLRNLLKTYHEEFSSIINKDHPKIKYLNPKVLNWDFNELQQNFKEFGIFGHLIAATILPYIYHDVEQVNNALSKNERETNEKFMEIDRKRSIYERLMQNPEISNRIFDTFDEINV